MHKKLLKGIAAVMSAALVLGSVVTGVVPANAAVTSVQTESGLYETTYNMGDLDIVENQGYSATATKNGTTVVMEFTGEYGYGGKFFNIPKEVLDAGFKGAKITLAEPTDKIGMKCAGDHEFDWSILVASSGTEITADPARIGDGVSGTVYESYEGQRTEEHLKYITAFGVIQPGNDSFSIVVETVTFITDNAVGEADPGTEEPTNPNPGITHTSTQTENGYETAYTLPEFELIYQAPDNVTITENKIEWTNQYGDIFYKIPQEIMDAGLIGFYCKGTVDNKIDLKLANSDDLWHALENGYGDSFDDAIAEIAADQRASANAFGIMSNCGENESMSATVDSVIFITENAIAGGTTDPGTEDPGTEDPTPAKLGKVKINSNKTSSTNNSVTLKWKKVDNSTAYKVYRSTSKNGEYKLIKTVKKTSFTDKTVKANKKYFYKVQAVNKDTGAKGAKSKAEIVTTKK